jgi:1-acyl-sn-glycerol-3-phosphate acyltransferase
MNFLNGIAPKHGEYFLTKKMKFIVIAYALGIYLVEWSFGKI